ncbi:hypothetical protein HA402_006929 [Bradysia odoriphaga]|nr:hypothetical protein HA402_006929 [Bradysia odoriphaga]
MFLAKCLLLIYFTTEIQSVNLDIELVMIKNEVVPELIETSPHLTMKILYPNGYYVKAGNIMRTIDVEEQPLVYWKTDPTKTDYYTIVMFSPDYPERSNPIMANFLHWMVVNIPGGRVEDGEVICDYLGALPEPDKELHRYIFLVYKQKAKSNYGMEERIFGDDFSARERFSIKKFVNRYLLSPVAGNIFLAEFDENAASKGGTFIVE